MFRECVSDSIINADKSDSDGGSQFQHGTAVLRHFCVDAGVQMLDRAAFFARREEALGEPC